MRLTKKSITAFKYEGKKPGAWDVRWDDEIPGFGVRVYPSDKKSFVLSYRHKGRKRLIVLGRFGADLTIDEARTKARQTRVQVKDGLDPIDEREKASKGRTFNDLADAYIEYAKQKKKTWGTDERRLDRHIPASWRRRQADAITADDVGRLHAKIGATTPYEANRLLSLLHRMFALAQRPAWAYVETGAANPAADIEKFSETKRARFARPDELPLIAEAIDQEHDVYVRGAFWLYLLTGARKNELLTARRENIEWELRRLRLDDTKSGEEQYLTLNAAAIAILQALPVVEGNPYIFVGAKKGQHLVNINKPWLRVRKAATVKYWSQHEDGAVAGLVTRVRADLGREPLHREVVAAAVAIELPVGLEDIRLHDLRRTFGSLLSRGGVDLNRIKEALRHSEISTTLIYARLGDDPVRDAVEDHGKRLLEMTGRLRPVEGGME